MKLKTPDSCFLRPYTESGPAQVSSDASVLNFVLGASDTEKQGGRRSNSGSSRRGWFPGTAMTQNPCQTVQAFTSSPVAAGPPVQGTACDSGSSPTGISLTLTCVPTGFSRFVSAPVNFPLPFNKIAFYLINRFFLLLKKP